MRKNKIRILHVAQAAGGVDRYIQMLLKYLDKEKFENITFHNSYNYGSALQAFALQTYLKKRRISVEDH